MDNREKRDFRDRDRINTNEDYEVRYAAEKLGVSRQELLAAIQVVGNMRADVERYLKGDDNNDNSNSPR